METHEPRSTARRIAEFVVMAPRTFHQNASIRAAVEASVVDTISVALAARTHPSHHSLERLAATLPDGPALGWSLNRGFQPQDAALVNSIAAHLLDFDDVTAPLRGHPSTVLLPALVAASSVPHLSGDACGPTGAELIDAFAVGFEVLVTLSEMYAPDHYAAGWHPTATIGIFGATAAVCRLRSMDMEQTTAALSLALSQTAGTRLQFGTTAKAFQVGAASAAGLRAAEAASAGFEGEAGALNDSPGAFGHLYARSDPSEDSDRTLPSLSLTAELSRLVKVGILPKLFPICYAADVPVRAAIEIVQRNGATFSTAEVDRVDVAVSPGTMDALVHAEPQTVDEARFSLPFVLAVALLRGGIGLEDLRDDVLTSSEVQQLMKTVTVTTKPWPSTPRRAEILVRRHDGINQSAACQQRIPAPQPLSEDSLLAMKVASCLTEATGRAARGASTPGPSPAETLSSLLEGWELRPAASLPQLWHSVLG